MPTLGWSATRSAGIGVARALRRARPTVTDGARNVQREPAPGGEWVRLGSAGDAVVGVGVA
jgi:hypothetical protein